MICDSGEEWKPIVGFETNYEVSNQGRVRRIWRGSGKIVNRPLSPLKTKFGYFRVCLFKEDARKYCHIHRLVMAAFIGALPEGMQVNHKDGDKENNSLENLEYVTAAENTHHACETGLRHHRLTKPLIYELLAQKGRVSQCELGRRYKMNQSQISMLFSGKIWKAEIEEYYKRLVG